MNIEFHYYALYHLARGAGFDEASCLVLALSSQLVDECVAPWRIESERGEEFTEVTQNYQFWDREVCDSVYRPFHFLPGDPMKAAARRRDNSPGSWAVTADSPLAREILIEALRSSNLYRIGLALHAYADTWAHQDFSADREEQNALGPGGLPPVGHLQALGEPDDPRGAWRDPRLAAELESVDNRPRFLAAAKMVFRFLRTYLRSGFSDEELVLGPLDEIWRGGAGKDLPARVSDYIVDLDIPPYRPQAWALEAGGRPREVLGPEPALGYSGSAWLGKAAAAARSLSPARGSIPAEGFQGSAFSAWNAAARRHRGLCRAKFASRGIA